MAIGGEERSRTGATVADSIEARVITIEEAIAKATAEIDAKIVDIMDQQAVMYAEHGASEEEMETLLADVRRDLEASKVTGLRDLRAWLERGGETEH